MTVIVAARSFLASFQQMGTDEKAAQIIARVVEGKLLLWPQDLRQRPAIYVGTSPTTLPMQASSR